MPPLTRTAEPKMMVSNASVRAGTTGIEFRARALPCSPSHNPNQACRRSRRISPRRPAANASAQISTALAGVARCRPRRTVAKSAAPPVRLPQAPASRERAEPGCGPLHATASIFSGAGKGGQLAGIASPTSHRRNAAAAGAVKSPRPEMALLIVYLDNPSASAIRDWVPRRRRMTSLSSSRS
jgi:hypothetical protein